MQQNPSILIGLEHVGFGHFHRIWRQISLIGGVEWQLQPVISEHEPSFSMYNGAFTVLEYLLNILS